VENFYFCSAPEKLSWLDFAFESLELFVSTLAALQRQGACKSLGGAWWHRSKHTDAFVCHDAAQKDVSSNFYCML